MRELVADLFSREAGRIVAYLTRLLGPAHLALAEEAVQEAMVRALRTWPFRGVPANPAAWLLTVARNHARDQLRRAAAAPVPDPLPAGPPPRLDDTLEMMLLCCHPSIPVPGQVALMLKLLGGLRVGEIAAVFLVPEETIAQRIVRAKKRIREEGLRADSGSLDAVHGALYLLFTAGYPEGGPHCAEALRLVECIREAGWATPDTEALRALFYLHTARASTPPDPRCLALGHQALAEAMRAERASAWHLEAAIAGAHLRDPAPWEEIIDLYQALFALKPTPVVRLNQAVALLRGGRREEGRAILDEIRASGALPGYAPLARTLEAEL